MSESIFSKIIKREIPADIVYENQDVIAINDINPIAPIHILIIPKIQIPTTNDLNEENIHIVSKMMLAAVEIAKQKGIEQKGYRLIMNCNEHGGQTVFHIHCHLLGGKQLSWG